MMKRALKILAWIAGIGAGLYILALLVLLLFFGLAAKRAKAEELIEPTPEEYAEIQKWIPATCCWTGHCCKKVNASAFILLPGNRVRVVSTGQELPRTGWSQDGQTWRCTCDFVPALQIWSSHPHAKTHCVFPAISGS